MPTVIVALPSVGDKVYKISSEKVPHLTICSLGDEVDSGQLADVVRYVQHASSLLGPFGMAVDHRGVLGPKQADVLFFDNGPNDAKRIKGFRHNLLQSDTVKKMYDAGEQFPDWIPHLTLGFPDTPANEDDDEYNPGIGYVMFDRIAVWDGDYEGPEFRLKYDDYDTEVAMGEKIDEFLAHYGRKGMKWGRHLSALSTSVDNVATVRLDNKARIPKNQKETDALNAAVKKACESNHKAMDTIVRSLNDGKASKMFASTKGDPKALQKIGAVLQKEANDGDKLYVHDIGFRADGNIMVVSTPKRGLRHADEDEMAFSVTSILQVTYNASGNIVSAEPIKDAKGEIVTKTHMGRIEHGLDLATDEFLAHYGIKGMRWGVRRKDPSGGDVSATNLETSVSKGDAKALSKMKPGSVVTVQDEDGTFKTMIKKKDGSWQDTHLSADADRFLSTRQKEGHELSDRELKEAIGRQQKIDEYNKLFNRDTRPDELDLRIKELEFKKKQLDFDKTLAEMKRANKRPGAMTRVNLLLAASTSSLDAFNKLNTSTGGRAGESLFKAAGLTAPNPKHSSLGGKHRK